MRSTWRERCVELYLGSCVFANKKASVNIACKHEGTVEGGQALCTRDEPPASLLLAARATFAQEEREDVAQSNVRKKIAVYEWWWGCTYAALVKLNARKVSRTE
jgi:hypothetical protein